MMQNYYDDNDEERDHERMYRGACSLGKFFLNPCLCVVTSLRLVRPRIRSSKRSKLKSTLFRDRERLRKQNESIDVLLHVGFPLIFIVVVFTVFLGCLPSLYELLLHPQVRPVTDADVNSKEILLRRYDVLRNDVGGWHLLRKFHGPSIRLELRDLEPDYGGLTYEPVEETSREIQFDDHMLYEKYRGGIILKDRPGPRLTRRYWHKDELEDVASGCKRPSWADLYYPTCNAVHELGINSMPNSMVPDLGNDETIDTHLINGGAYRDVWLLEESLSQTHLGILKTIRWDASESFKSLTTVLRDALIMERLSASPRIVDIYSHCGTSIVVEEMPNELEKFVVPGEGYIDQEDLHDEENLNPQNDYTAEEKLDMALAMAESLADLHGFKDGVIVHDDVQLCQWLRHKNGKLKLGDFNRAEIMSFHPSQNRYCKYENGQGFGNYRSPEEFAVRTLDEKIDVFSFGNNIYALLTGLWVFYETTDDGVVQNELINGKLAFVDPRYRDRSLIERKLVEIMEKCWAYNPSKRPTIFEIVQFLREVVVETKALKKRV